MDDDGGRVARHRRCCRLIGGQHLRRAEPRLRGVGLRADSGDGSASAAQNQGALFAEYQREPRVCGIAWIRLQ